MTGSTLYEAVEQHALWNRLLAAIISDLDSGTSEVMECHSSKEACTDLGTKGCGMVKYILTTFHGHDEEIETVHLPVVFTVILGLLAVRRK